MPKKKVPDTGDLSNASVFAELQRPSLREAVIENFHSAIIRGALKPGQRITESQMCRLMGVSRTTAREAFQQLRSLGVVRADRRKMFVSSEPGPGEIRDIYAFRGLCEGLVVEQAKKNLTVDDLEMLREHIREMKWASRMRDLDAFRRADLAFHELIWRANGKKHLFRVLKAVTDPYHFFFMALLRRATRNELLEMTRLHRGQLEDLCRPGSGKLRPRTEKRYRSMGEQFLRLYQKYSASLR